MLGWLPDKEVAAAFEEKEWAKQNSAADGIRFALGVNKAMLIPQGVANNHFSSSLQPLVLQRYAECGHRLQGVNKGNYEEKIKYWASGVDGDDKITSVFSTLVGSSDLQMPVKLEDATD